MTFQIVGKYLDNRWIEPASYRITLQYNGYDGYHKIDIVVGKDVFDRCEIGSTRTFNL